MTIRSTPRTSAATTARTTRTATAPDTDQPRTPTATAAPPPEPIDDTPRARVDDETQANSRARAGADLITHPGAARLATGEGAVRTLPPPSDGLPRNADGELELGGNLPRPEDMAPGELYRPFSQPRRGIGGLGAQPDPMSQYHDWDTRTRSERTDDFVRNLRPDAAEYVRELRANGVPEERQVRRFGDTVVWSGADRQSGRPSIQVMNYPTGDRSAFPDGRQGDLLHSASQRTSQDMHSLVEGQHYSPRESRGFLRSQGRNLNTLMAFGIAGLNPGGVGSASEAAVGVADMVHEQATDRPGMIGLVNEILPDPAEHLGSNPYAESLTDEQRSAIRAESVAAFPVD